jgi:hypothetical protein
MPTVRYLPAEVETGFLRLLGIDLRSWPIPDVLRPGLSGGETA